MGKKLEFLRTDCFRTLRIIVLNDSLDELIQTRVVDYPDQGPGTRQLNNASPLSLKDIYAVNVPFWPKLAHFSHFSLYNPNHSYRFLVKIGQNTKPIALLFGQNWPILATFHSTIQIIHIDFWSKLGKIPSL